jgi:hypothetical protein
LALFERFVARASPSSGHGYALPRLMATFRAISGSETRYTSCRW